MAGSGTSHMRSDCHPLLSVEHLIVGFPNRRGHTVHAVSDVSFDIVRGETVGLVGESGCGKSTVARSIVQLVRPSSGRVLLDGEDLSLLSGRDLRRQRARLQMIFQDPISSLNPLRRVRDIVAEGLVIAGLNRRDAGPAVDQVLDTVGLDPRVVGDRRARDLSGGQCQRVSIARALVIEPELIICDEPVSSLDVSVQAQILNLVEEIKARHGLTLLFIAHDLAVVKHVSDRVIVMYLGKVCEVGPAGDIYASPAHPYTRILLDSIPEPNLDMVDSSIPLQGEPPSPTAPPSGCRFRTRCPRAKDICGQEEPVLLEIRPEQYTACHFPL